MGASVGCGSGRVAPEPADASRDAAGPPDATESDAHPSDGAAAPQSVCDCARPGTFRCTACASGQTPVDGRCPDKDGTGCTCDESVAIATPTDCQHPEQFVCVVYPDSDAMTAGSGFSSFVNDWYAFVHCSCDPTRPLTPSDCACAQCSFGCATPWSCGDPPSPADASYAGVAYACACLPPVTLIK